jgi:hypothetical protein
VTSVGARGLTRHTVTGKTLARVALGIGPEARERASVATSCLLEAAVAHASRDPHAAMASGVVPLPPLLRPDRMTLGVECGETSVAIGAFALCWSERANIVLHPGVCRPGKTHAEPDREIWTKKGI